MANRAHKLSARSKPKRISKEEQRHYWPYLPMLLLTLAIMFVSIVQPRTRFGLLAYATEMSREQLLVSTNERRLSNEVGSLALNATLNEAAQAKANDMVARNYWSHNTPDGEEPWVFFDEAGYEYIKAGENLAYGFSSSEATVIGWMNSQSHRDNMLDGVFTEVGFGFANGENFNDHGQETVVVAMYGRPQVLADNAQEQAQSPEPEEAPTEQPVAEKPQEQPDQQAKEQPVNSDTLMNKEPEAKVITRVETISGGNHQWLFFATGLTTGALVVFLLLRHAVGLRHLLRDSERFVLRHPLLDTLALSLILVGTILLQASGVIR